MPEPQCVNCANHRPQLKSFWTIGYHIVDRPNHMDQPQTLLNFQQYILIFLSCFTLENQHGKCYMSLVSNQKCGISIEGFNLEMEEVHTKTKLAMTAI